MVTILWWRVAVPGLGFDPLCPSLDRVGASLGNREESIFLETGTTGIAFFLYSELAVDLFCQSEDLGWKYQPNMNM